MPVYPSYDFIDVLALEGEPEHRAGGARHERSRRRAHRAPERRQVRALQSHRRRRHGHRLRGGGHHARPPLRASGVERPRLLARRHRRPRRTIRSGRWTSRSAGRSRRRSTRPTCCSSSSTRRPACIRATARVAEMLRDVAEAVAARRQQGRRSEQHGLLRVLQARRRRSDSRVGAATARAPATCSTCSSSRLPESAPEDEEALRVAVVGRPNVGKSSFVNRLLGEERLVVSDIAGTTRDAIDTPMTLPRPRAHLRRHGRPAPADEDRRRHRVLLVAAHAPRDRARRHLRPRRSTRPRASSTTRTSRSPRWPGRRAAA